MITKSSDEEPLKAAGATSLPATSLIICSRDRPELLAETVESVLRGTEVPAELVVVDQSRDPHPALQAATAERSCELRYLLTPSTGLSRARNAGIRAAKYDLLVFTDDDVLVTPGWFDTLIRALLEAGPRAVVTGRVPPTAPEAPGTFAPSTILDESAAVYLGRPGKDVLFPQSMAMNRSAVDEVGGFDERLGPGTTFPSAEDNDFGFRLLEAGYRIVYLPEAVLYHRAWRNRREYLPPRRRCGVGQGAYYAKHLSLRDPYMLRRMLRYVKDHIIDLPRKLAEDRLRAAGDVMLVLGTLFGASRWLLTQRRSR